MLKLYLPEPTSAPAVREKIAELCLAIEVTTTPFPDLPNPQLPALKDDNHTIVGEKAILHYLEELAAFKAEWDKFQSDSCYCNEDGEIE